MAEHKPVSGQPTSSYSTANADYQALQKYATDLADRVENALSQWVVAAVIRRLGDPLEEDVQVNAEQAGRDAAATIGPKVRELLQLDIDQQWTNPLAIIRTATSYPTQVLTQAGAAPVERDETAKRIHPNDIYDLTPGGFAEFGEKVAEAGIAWGAAKAHIHLQRRASKT